MPLPMLITMLVVLGGGSWIYSSRKRIFLLIYSILKKNILLHQIIFLSKYQLPVMYILTFKKSSLGLMFASAASVAVIWCPAGTVS